jgi:hypothetical protein
LGYSENGNGTGGTLSVTDATHTAKVALLGNYMASSFAAASDGHGGSGYCRNWIKFKNLAHPAIEPLSKRS